MRPVVVTASNLESSLSEVFSAYREPLLNVPEVTRRVTNAEGGLSRTQITPMVPDGVPVEVASMRKIKGLERACILWPTWHTNRSHESAFEWAYITLTRSAELAIIAIDPQQLDDETASVLALLRDGRPLYWDAEGVMQVSAIRVSCR